jgi:hypothetical protein
VLYGIGLIYKFNPIDVDSNRLSTEPKNQRYIYREEDVICILLNRNNNMKHPKNYQITFWIDET